MKSEYDSTVVDNNALSYPATEKTHDFMEGAK